MFTLRSFANMSLIFWLQIEQQQNLSRAFHRLTNFITSIAFNLFL